MDLVQLLAVVAHDATQRLHDRPKSLREERCQIADVFEHERARAFFLQELDDPEDHRSARVGRAVQRPCHAERLAGKAGHVQVEPVVVVEAARENVRVEAVGLHEVRDELPAKVTIAMATIAKKWWCKFGVDLCGLYHILSFHM